MKTVKQVSLLTGVSVRTLHYYHAIGLLKPTQVTDAGYRLYDDAALERLNKILVYRELGMPLDAIAFGSPRGPAQSGAGAADPAIAGKTEKVAEQGNFGKGNRNFRGKIYGF